MKLYHWRHKFSYGQEACVAAASLEEAQEAMRNSLADYMSLGGARATPLTYEAEHPEIVEKMLAGDEYELVVLEPGRVVWTERS